MRNVAEFRPTGEILTYPFVAGEDAFVWEFDGDPYITSDLDRGHYAPSGSAATLARVGQNEYVVTRPDGERSGYYGYDAPWREGQDPRAGRLIYRADRHGNRISFAYDQQGRLTAITDTAGRTFALTWEGERVTAVTGIAYDGLSPYVLKEYTGTGAPARQYHLAAGEVVAAKGQVIPGREPSLSTMWLISLWRS